MNRERTGLTLTFASAMLLFRLVATVIGANQAPDLPRVDRTLIDQRPAPSVDLTPLTPHSFRVIGPDEPTTITLP